MVGRRSGFLLRPDHNFPERSVVKLPGCVWPHQKLYTSNHHFSGGSELLGFREATSWVMYLPRYLGRWKCFFGSHKSPAQPAIFLVNIFWKKLWKLWWNAPSLNSFYANLDTFWKGNLRKGLGHANSVGSEVRMNCMAWTVKTTCLTRQEA